MSGGSSPEQRSANRSRDLAFLMLTPDRCHLLACVPVNDPRAEIPRIGWREVGYFLAEVAVYVAIAWWGLTRADSFMLGLLLALGLVSIFAGSWGLLASPKAMWPLRGIADTAFRIAWFGFGLAAAISLMLGK